MGLLKQAKALTIIQEKIALAYIETTRHSLRNKVIFLLSIKAGFRAKEIASLRWRMCTDAQGNIVDYISLEDIAAKGCSGRKIPINKTLKTALAELKENSHYQYSPAASVIRSERSKQFSAQTIVNYFHKLYGDLEFEGCSSHSGRRTFVTRLAKSITKAGGSLHDVQRLAGHANLQSTQKYIEFDSDAAQRAVDLI